MYNSKIQNNETFSQRKNIAITNSAINDDSLSALNQPIIIAESNEKIIVDCNVSLINNQNSNFQKQLSNQINNNKIQNNETFSSEKILQL